VDVPALDAVLFLTPRSSQVDVVQSLGRVMRNAPDKKRGYVILPVVIPAGVEAHEALNDNKTYAVVWQVLQALRSHDDRFDAMVNKLELIGKDTRKMEVIAITDKLQRKQEKASGAKNKDAGKGQFTIGEAVKRPSKDDQADLQFEIGEIERAIYAKLVQKVGNRHHWEDWANDIAKIAHTHIDRIKGILENPDNVKERDAFNAFAAELRDDLNDSIGDDDVVEMLAQHLITKPVFDALFEGYSFAQHNPMSLAMQNVLDTLHEHHLEKEVDTLQSFYDSVKMRAEGIDNAAGKQKIVVELYDKFFRNAFPKMTERLGIVYTPVEVVDFIIHSVGHILQTEFGQTLGSKGVHIIDPFTGTGTFITRLLQSGLIGPEELPHKYQNEIHANEIVLLAYYIAAINIEAAYHSIAGGDYEPFEGICLTDTFQMYGKEDLGDQVLAKNSGRRKKQKALDIRVVIGNPPYSAGQESANDNNSNTSYLHLDERIRSTYAKKSNITMVRSLYDNYIRAIRWASDRIGDSGVIGFVTNAGFVESGSADGLRQCLAEEFSSIYVFHLRGNQRTAGELSRREGGKIFGSGSRAPIAISLLVKNPDAARHRQIHFHDIGDYLSQDDKFEIISGFGSISGISDAGLWTPITPDAYGDWIKQRDDSLKMQIILGSKKGEENAVFNKYSNGVITNRDYWCYSNSKTKLENQMRSMIDFYNSEVKRFSTNNTSSLPAIEFISKDESKIKWSEDLINDLSKHRAHSFADGKIMRSLFRPFTKSWLYSSKPFNWSRYLMPQIFPDDSVSNIVICVPGTGAKGKFSPFITNIVPCRDNIEKGQCFPLYLYDGPTDESEQTESLVTDLFTQPAPEKNERKRRDAITDEGLAHFQNAYPTVAICKEDVFYYVYGLLHSPHYRERYADNLSKELPRIPRVKAAADFWAFSRAGRGLAELHLNYETVEKYPLTDADYRVEKMRYGRNGKDKDLTTLIYNEKITLAGIPLEAYEYVVNGKPALDWVVERQCVKTDKDSGIVNDANDWAIETMNNPRYPLELFQRVITLSLKTMAIVRALPALGELYP
jgi:predicted helicase